MKPLFFALIASSLFAAGCAVTDAGAEPTLATDQPGAVTPAATGCTLRRPLTWTVSGATCKENHNTTLPLADGAQYVAYSAGGGAYGAGSITVKCSSGSIVTVSQSCRKSTGGGGAP